MAAGNGYFERGGVAWRVGRERALLLGGGRALLMQVAHPLVAAGVAAHSDYRERPWRRLEQTMAAVWTIVYGSRAEADRAAASVRAVHECVRGRLPAPMGPFPAGTEYSALDPSLLLWVHATLIDTALLVHREWVGRLDGLERSAYYEEMKTFARLLGTPKDVIPATLGDFEAYMEERLESDEISVTDTAREIAHTVLHPPLPLPLRPAAEALGIVTAGLLPAPMRGDYGLRWDPVRAAVLATSRQWVRRIALPLMPDLARAAPPARRAEGRSGMPIYPGR